LPGEDLLQKEPLGNHAEPRFKNRSTRINGIEGMYIESGVTT